MDPARAEDEAALAVRSKLALATAEDAVRALGGELVLPEESAQRPVGRIQLPQPQQPQQPQSDSSIGLDRVVSLVGFANDVGTQCL